MHASVLKLYLYGYLNKVRSSRKPEKECSRKWTVMQCIMPFDEREHITLKHSKTLVDLLWKHW